MIDQITIRNFKSIADVTVKLSDVTVLVGRSGVGKTNFVEAIRFLRDVLRGTQDLHQRWPAIRPLPKTSKPTCFELTFSVHGIADAYTYKIELVDLRGQMQLTKEALYLGKRCLFDQNQPLKLGEGGRKIEWSVEPALVEVPQPGPIALGRLPALSEAVIAYTALTDSIGCYAFPGDVMLSSPNRASPTAGFSDSGANHLSTLKKIVSDIHDLTARQRINQNMSAVSPGVSSIELDRLQSPTKGIVGHVFNDKTLALELSQESEGFRRFLAHLLALYQRPPKILMIFEHPEDGIHPGALSLLAEEFRSAPGDRRGQVILTTHSPGLLDNFEASNIRVVEKTGFATDIGPLAEDQIASLREELLEPGELLTVTPAKIDRDESVVPTP